MKAAVYGATGMIGQGVLRDCLLDPEVDEVLAVGRTPTGKHDPKLRELDLSLQPDVDACFFCLGVSSAGMKEPEYRRITYDLTMATARIRCWSAASRCGGMSSSRTRPVPSATSCSSTRA